MKLVIENFTMFRRFGHEEAIRKIAKAGFDAIDFSFYWVWGEDDFLNRPDYLDYARHLRAVAEENGICIAQAHAPFDNKFEFEPAKFEVECEHIRRSIRAAGVMGAKQIILHNMPVSEGENFFEKNLAYFLSFADTARESGIRIAAENLFGRDPVTKQFTCGRLSTPEELLPFVDALPKDAFCTCIDVGHSRCCGVDPAQFIRAAGHDRVFALHIQDTDGTADAHTLPYLSKQNWEDICRALKEVDYQGDFTFEIFAFLGSFPVDLLPSALKLACDTGRKLIGMIQG